MRGVVESGKWKVESHGSSFEILVFSFHFELFTLNSAEGGLS
jgi:hypothetical protein